LTVSVPGFLDYLLHRCDLQAANAHHAKCSAAAVG